MGEIDPSCLFDDLNHSRDLSASLPAGYDFLFPPRQGSHGATFLRKQSCFCSDSTLTTSTSLQVEAGAVRLASPCWGSAGCHPQGGRCVLSSEARPGKESPPSSQWLLAQLPSLGSQALTSHWLLARAALSAWRPPTDPTLPLPRL